jgi:hypothetical protein
MWVGAVGIMHRSRQTGTDQLGVYSGSRTSRYDQQQNIERLNQKNHLMLMLRIVDGAL